MSFFSKLKSELRTISNISDHIDTDAAVISIKNNVPFRGPNVWILAFSIIIASVGLNVNSTAVIIGAMLISPLMGPIIGVGLGLGINDTPLIRDALKNLLIMVIISLLASFFYFLVTPLRLANPTELLSRTNPTIYDVMIALFGGAAGMLELSRKEKGTVLSGVAIATALMPPLCTAGYGLASGNIRYFFGALLLFAINGVFIILATYLMSKILEYKPVVFQDPVREKRTRRWISFAILVVTVPSLISAFNMIKSNNMSQNATNFVTANRSFEGGYIYDYELDTRDGYLTLYIMGNDLSEEEKDRLRYSASEYGLKADKLIFNDKSMIAGESGASEEIIDRIYARTDSEIGKRDAQIASLEAELAKYRKAEIPYEKISKEVSSQYPEIVSMLITRGAEVSYGNISSTDGITILAKTQEPLDETSIERLTEWLKIRLDEPNLVVINVLTDTHQEQQ